MDKFSPVSMGFRLNSVIPVLEVEVEVSQLYTYF